MNPFFQQISDTDQKQSQFLRQSPLDTMFDLSSSALSELIFSLKFVTEISWWIRGLRSLDIHGLVQMQHNSNSWYNFEFKLGAVALPNVKNSQFVHKQMCSTGSWGLDHENQWNFWFQGKTLCYWLPICRFLDHENPCIWFPAGGLLTEIFFKSLRLCRLWRQIWNILLFLDQNMGWMYVLILEMRLFSFYLRWCFISPAKWMSFWQLRTSMFLLTPQVQLFALPSLGTLDSAFLAIFSSKITWLFTT